MLFRGLLSPLLSSTLPGFPVEIQMGARGPGAWGKCSTESIFPGHREGQGQDGCKGQQESSTRKALGRS